MQNKEQKCCDKCKPSHLVKFPQCGNTMCECHWVKCDTTSPKDLDKVPQWKCVGCKQSFHMSNKPEICPYCDDRETIESEECHCGKNGHALNSVNCPVHAYMIVPTAPSTEGWRDEVQLICDLYLPIQGEINKTSNRNLRGFIVGLVDELLSLQRKELREKIENMPTCIEIVGRQDNVSRRDVLSLLEPKE